MTLELMGRGRLQSGGDKKGVFFSSCEVGFQWIPPKEGCIHHSGLFASVGQMGIGFGISPNSRNSSKDSVKLPYADLHVEYVSSPESGSIGVVGVVPKTGSCEVVEAVGEGIMVKKKKKKKGRFNMKLKISNPSLRRLISGAIAGAVSRTTVAPFETIRTHLMVGSCGHSSSEVFQAIMKTDGWKGLFRGNFVNVIRVAPSKAVELFAYDTVKKNLSPKPGEEPKIRIPPSLVAGACAGVSSTLLTYPLELLKTRITIQKGVYDNLLHAFLKIVREEGPGELYRGLTPSLIGVVPYAATNYFAYDMLRKACRKVFKKEEIGNVATLLIGSAAGAISCSATFPLEVARKYMQVGAVSGKQVYRDMLHAMLSILEQEGVPGLYRGLRPSCMKLVPAAGISFMCYEACKRILVENENEA